MTKGRGYLVKRFQSTPSARRATILYKRMDGKIMGFQSTPSARRATAAARRTCATVCISIHALREEGDSLPTSLALREGIFQSTPSARRATTPSGTARGRPFDFNPRPPRGGRPPTSCRSDRRSLFQSTPSARRATDAATEERLAAIISIHALREEGDGALQKPHTRTADFNPRPPRGGRQQKRRKNPPRLFHYTHLCTI